MRDTKLENLDLNQLLALHWLIEERSVTRASRRLSVSQPAMSRSLASLRRMFGDPLLVQTGRAMTPTPRALAVREPLARAVETLRQAVRAPDAFDPATATISFRIGANDYPAAACVDAWARHIAREAPGANLTLVPLSPGIPPALASGTVDLVVLPDLALKNLAAFVDVTQYVQKRIGQDRFVCVMRPGHPAARKRMTAEAFAALDHVLVSPSGSGEASSTNVWRSIACAGASPIGCRRF